MEVVPIETNTVLMNGCRALALMSSRKENAGFWIYPDNRHMASTDEFSHRVDSVLTMAVDRLSEIISQLGCESSGWSGRRGCTFGDYGPSLHEVRGDCQNALDNLADPPPAQYVYLIAGGLWVIVGVASCRARAGAARARPCRWLSPCPRRPVMERQSNARE